jgi:hypothetical protein
LRRRRVLPVASSSFPACHARRCCFSLPQLAVFQLHSRLRPRRMDRRATIAVLDSSGWIHNPTPYTAATRRASREWQPLTVTRPKSSLRGGSLSGFGCVASSASAAALSHHSQLSRAASVSASSPPTPQRVSTQVPLHTVAPDVRARAQGEPARPLSRSNTKEDRSYLRRDEEMYWDEGLWRWMPTRGGWRRRRRGGGGSPGVSSSRAAQHSPGVSSSPAMITRGGDGDGAGSTGGASYSDGSGEPSRWVSEGALSRAAEVPRTAEERALDGVRSSVLLLQDELGDSLLQQALGRMRRKLVSKFAAMQAFHQMDVDCSGTLDLAEFAVALKRLGVSLGQAQLELVFSSIDQVCAADPCGRAYVAAAALPMSTRRGRGARTPETFLCVHWVAVPKALRARRVNILRRMARARSSARSSWRRCSRAIGWPPSRRGGWPRGPRGSSAGTTRRRWSRIARAPAPR